MVLDQDLGVEAACFWLAGDHRYEVEVGNDIDEMAAVALNAEGPVVTFGGGPTSASHPFVRLGCRALGEIAAAT
ncbi:MAG TPA: hypothetical protein VJ301_02785 [Propionibacteriaceae bacterium]|nr:hypothetical protein [Propionibacteriaceae bacterium]